MSILGYDVVGRPLRAGDRVVVVIDVKPKWADRPAVVVGKTAKAQFADALTGAEDYLEHDDGACARACNCRRIDDRTDHQPCGETFAEIMQRIKRREGVPA